MPTTSAIERFTSLKNAGSRSRFRKNRIAELEQEQIIEDLEALAMTEVCGFRLTQVDHRVTSFFYSKDQKNTLLSSFDSVKAEFSDLDGLSWSNSVPIDLVSSFPYVIMLWSINFLLDL